MAVLIVSFLLIVGVLYEYTTGVSRRQLKTQLRLAAQAVSTEGMAYFEGVNVGDSRITWIDADGTVLYDNRADAASMENHLQREEVRKALQLGYGESRRYSYTRMEQALYAAERLKDGTVLRLSVSQYSVLTLLLGMLQPICIIVGLAAIFSLFLAARLAKLVVRPLNALDLEHPTENEGYDELSPLLRRIAAQQKELKTQEQALMRKQGELSVILENMNEGMLLLREDGHILSINAAAARLLNADSNSVGKAFLTVSRNLELQETVREALSGKRTERVLPLRDGRYQVCASPIMSGTLVQGAAIVLIDVTERERTEEIRREFSANVSHELKTPLHAISGYAELMKNGMVKTEDVRPFSEKIHAEAQRTIQLIEDIISLSRLDEGAEDMRWERIELKSLAEAAADSLSEKAKAAGVTVQLAGEAVELIGIPALLRTVIINLCDNAVKYNRPGGLVRIEVQSQGGQAVLKVKDNGIGIPKKDQSRIFERFYRVDKSHSRAIGGTGLGLSIVKHAVRIHRGAIAVQSNVGEGSCITVTLPKEQPERVRSTPLPAAEDVLTE